MCACFHVYVYILLLIWGQFVAKQEWSYSSEPHDGFKPHRKLLLARWGTFMQQQHHSLIIYYFNLLKNLFTNLLICLLTNWSFE